MGDVITKSVDSVGVGYEPSWGDVYLVRLLSFKSSKSYSCSFWIAAEYYASYFSWGMHPNKLTRDVDEHQRSIICEVSMYVSWVVYQCAKPLGLSEGGDRARDRIRGGCENKLSMFGRGGRDEMRHGALSWGKIPQQNVPSLTSDPIRRHCWLASSPSPPKTMRKA